MRDICQPLVIVKPEEITNDIFVSSNVPEDDYDLYDASKTYGIGDRIMDPETHLVWESVDENNKGNTPWESPEKWLSPGTTNRWAVFDEKLSSVTTGSEEIKYCLTFPKAINVIAILNTKGLHNINVKMILEDQVVYEVDHSMRPQLAYPGWYNWFFSERRVKKDLVDLNLPAYPGASIEITLEGTGDISVGAILFGQQRRFGYGIQYGAGSGIMSYSRIRRDEDTGDLELFKRPSARRMSMNLIMPNKEADSVYHFMEEIESIPVLLVGHKNYDMFTGYGIVKNFEVVIPDYSESECSIDFEGFI